MTLLTKRIIIIFIIIIIGFVLGRLSIRALFNLLMAVMISIIVSLPLYWVISKCLNFTGGNISQDIPSIPLADFEFVSYIIGVISFLAIGVFFIILFLNKLIYRKSN